MAHITKLDKESAMTIPDDLPNYGTDETISETIQDIDDCFDDPAVEPLTDDGRAVTVLRQCVSLYNTVLKSSKLGVKMDAIKDVSELFSVPPALVMHAVEHGPLNAHYTFRHPDSSEPPPTKRGGLPAASPISVDSKN